MKKATKREAPLIQIGTNEGGIQALSETIVKVISAPVGDNVKIAALETLKNGLPTGPTTFHSCYIGGDK